MNRLRSWGLASFGLAFLLLLVLLPALLTLPMALFAMDGLSAAQWAGVDHFLAMSKDPLFWQSLGNSLKVAAIAVPLRLALALGLALLLHKDQPGAGLVRAAALAPSFAPDIAWALVWLLMLNPLYGPVAWLLTQLGFSPDIWLVNAVAARSVLVWVSLWLIGEMVVVLIAARREINPEIYEAAALEGAGVASVFRRITLPLLLPVVVLLAARDAALMFQTSFTPALMITKGGPQYGTLLLPLYVHQNGFEYLRFGYAAALNLVLFVVTLLMVALQALWLRRWIKQSA